jgi:hypothetical protein
MRKFDQAPRRERNVEQDRMAFMEAIKSAEIREIDVDFEDRDVNSLNEELGSAKLFLLGETHGVKENPDVIYTLFRKFGFKTLALEWDKELQSQVEIFLESGELDFEAIKGSPDGRITAGHFAMLKKLKDEGLLGSVVCFDEEPPSGEWNERDVYMAKNIIANLSDSATLVVAGNLHTELASMTFDDEEEEHHPMGENIKKQIPTVPTGKIKYLTGQFHNYGTKEFSSEVDSTESVKAKFYKSSEGVYVFELPEGHPAVVPNPSEIL